MATTNKTKKELYRLKAEALQDAERASELDQSSNTLLELALCLFANSSTTETAKATRGMSILSRLNREGNYLLATYELIKQLRMRHKYEEAIQEFLQIIGKDKNKLRFHKFVTHYNASVIGLFYQRRGGENLASYALEACKLTEEVIAYDHHSAREIVDLCYLKGIAEFPIEESIRAVDKLRGSENVPWKQLAEIAQNESAGKEDLLDALFFGLGDPAIWSRIGTFYSDFVKDFEYALEFYSHASEIDPGSPVYHFNKARIYALKIPDCSKGRAEIDFALHLKENKYGWYKNNEEEILKIREKIYSMAGG